MGKTYSEENSIFNLSRLDARTIIMARYGMLECSKNYSHKYGTKTCKECLTIDNEEHRLNNCKRWRNVNLFNYDVEIDFNLIYSQNVEILKSIASILQSVWNLENHCNEMRS